MFARFMLISGLALGLFLAGTTAQAAKQEKKKKGGGVAAGAVSDVKREKDDTGTITVKLQARKKKDEAAANPAEEKKFKVTKDTTFAKLSGQKDDIKSEAAKFSDVQTGQRVRITLKDGQADTAAKVEIMQGKKAK